jgi:hypothetical protein
VIRASHTALLFTQNDERLVIREVDSIWHPSRLLPSSFFILIGSFVLFTTLSGAGMAQATTLTQQLSKSLFLGLIALIMGIIPLTVGLRLWLVREEIVIHSRGTLSRNLLLGPWRIAGSFIPYAHPSHFHIRTSRGSKTGIRHEVIFQAPENHPETRLISLKSLADASHWKLQITTFLTERHTSIPTEPPKSPPT